jgi:hypothetical protein
MHRVIFIPWLLPVALLFFCGLVYLISAKAMFSVSAGSLLVIVLQFINQLKVHYYKDKLMFPDFYMLADLSNADTLLHYPAAGLA